MIDGLPITVFPELMFRQLSSAPDPVDHGGRGGEAPPFTHFLAGPETRLADEPPLSPAERMQHEEVGDTGVAIRISRDFSTAPAFSFAATALDWAGIENPDLNAARPAPPEGLAGNDTEFPLSPVTVETGHEAGAELVLGKGEADWLVHDSSGVRKVAMHADAFVHSGVFGRGLSTRRPAVLNSGPEHRSAETVVTGTTGENRPGLPAPETPGPGQAGRISQNVVPERPATHPGGRSVSVVSTAAERVSAHAPRTDGPVNVPGPLTHTIADGGEPAGRIAESAASAESRDSLNLQRSALARQIGQALARAQSQPVRVTLQLAASGVKVLVRIAEISRSEQESLKTQIREVLAEYSVGAAEIKILTGPVSSDGHQGGGT